MNPAPKRRIRAFLTFAALAVLNATAHAATSCTVTSVSNLTFGAVDPTGTLVDTSATLNYQCTFSGFLSGAAVSMCFNIGSGSGGTSYAPRRMKSGAETMNFQIYTDAARSQVWGSALGTGTPASVQMQFPVSLGGSTKNGSLTMYGRVPAGQTSLAVGAYASSFVGNSALMTFGANEAFLSVPSYPTCNATGTDNFDFDVGASVAPRCTIGTASDMNFGSAASNFGGNIDQTSAITMTCTRNTAWQVGLDNGQNASGSTRRMLGSGQYVAYELYRDNGRLLRWGNAVGTDTFGGAGSGLVQSLNVFGRVSPQTAVPAGNYSDKITVTVTY